MLSTRLWFHLSKTFSTKIFPATARALSSATFKMEVHPIPALSDNYMYLLVDQTTRQALIVDPVEPDKVLAKVKELDVELKHILATHHHWDHSGGNQQMLSLLQQQTKPAAKSAVHVYGGGERVEALTKQVKNDDLLELGSLKIRCIDTSCHTTDSISYFVDDGKGGLYVFTGDTLFIAGCGKFFEGTAAAMLNAFDKLSQLPDQTKVFCGHEYTYNNLRFALTVEPDNKHVQKKLAWAKTQSEGKCATIPSTIGDEKLTNPFMRVREASIQTCLNESDPVQVMAELRALKDKFK